MSHSAAVNFAKGNDWHEEVQPITGKDANGRKVTHAGPLSVYFVSAEDSDVPLGGITVTAFGFGAPTRFIIAFDASQMDTIVTAAAQTTPFDLWRVIKVAGDFRRTRRVRILKSLADVKP